MTDLNELKRVSNFEAGNVWAGWVIAKLASNWPKNITISCPDVLNETGVSIDDENNQIESVYDLINWLSEEGYVRHRTRIIGYIFTDLQITQKSMNILDKKIDSLSSRKLRDEFIDAARDIGKETAKGQLSDLFGQFIGGIIKSVST